MMVIIRKSRALYQQIPFRIETVEVTFLKAEMSLRFLEDSVLVWWVELYTQQISFREKELLAEMRLT